jgi:hypothetical protein
MAKTSRRPRTLLMKIGLVSDTHLLRFGKALPGVLKQGLIAQRVELILHLGDFTNLAVADMFRRIAPFDAVAGNNDLDEICRSFGRQKILAVAGLRIGMIRGDGTRKTNARAGTGCLRRRCAGCHPARPQPVLQIAWRCVASQPRLAHRQAPQSVLFLRGPGDRERSRGSNAALLPRQACAPLTLRRRGPFGRRLYCSAARALRPDVRP